MANGDAPVSVPANRSFASRQSESPVEVIPRDRPAVQLEALHLHTEQLLRRRGINFFRKGWIDLMQGVRLSEGERRYREEVLGRVLKNARRYGELSIYAVAYNVFDRARRSEYVSREAGRDSSSTFSLMWTTDKEEKERITRRHGELIKKFEAVRLRVGERGEYVCEEGQSEELRRIEEEEVHGPHAGGKYTVWLDEEGLGRGRLEVEREFEQEIGRLVEEFKRELGRLFLLYPERFRGVEAQGHFLEDAAGQYRIYLRGCLKELLLSRWITERQVPLMTNQEIDGMLSRVQEGQKELEREREAIELAMRGHVCELGDGEYRGRGRDWLSRALSIRMKGGGHVMSYYVAHGQEGEEESARRTQENEEGIALYGRGEELVEFVSSERGQGLQLRLSEIVLRAYTTNSVGGVQQEVLSLGWELIGQQLGGFHSSSEMLTRLREALLRFCQQRHTVISGSSWMGLFERAFSVDYREERALLVEVLGFYVRMCQSEEQGNDDATVGALSEIVHGKNFPRRFPSDLFGVFCNVNALVQSGALIRHRSSTEVQSIRMRDADRAEAALRQRDSQLSETKEELTRERERRERLEKTLAEKEQKLEEQTRLATESIQRMSSLGGDYEAGNKDRARLREEHSAAVQESLVAKAAAAESERLLVQVRGERDRLAEENTLLLSQLQKSQATCENLTQKCDQLTRRCETLEKDAQIFKETSIRGKREQDTKIETLMRTVEDLSARFVLQRERMSLAEKQVESEREGRKHAEGIVRDSPLLYRVSPCPSPSHARASRPSSAAATRTDTSQSSRLSISTEDGRLHPDAFPVPVPVPIPSSAGKHQSSRARAQASPASLGAGDLAVASKFTFYRSPQSTSSPIKLPTTPVSAPSMRTPIRRSSGSFDEIARGSLSAPSKLITGVVQLQSPEKKSAAEPVSTASTSNSL